MTGLGDVVYLHQRCQVCKVQAGGGLVHVWGAFHSGAKLPLVLPHICLSELYRGILWNTLVLFARQHFRDNYSYQDDNATPHQARKVCDFLQQGDVNHDGAACKFVRLQPRTTYFRWIGPCDLQYGQPPQNFCKLRQALLAKLPEIPAERLQYFVASMPRCLVAIIAARGDNAPNRPTIHKTTPTGCIMQNIKFVSPDLPQLASNDI